MGVQVAADRGLAEAVIPRWNDGIITRPWHAVPVRDGPRRGITANAAALARWSQSSIAMNAALCPGVNLRSARSMRRALQRPPCCEGKFPGTAGGLIE
jgi:hypothetical protein